MDKTPYQQSMDTAAFRARAACGEENPSLLLERFRSVRGRVAVSVLALMNAGAAAALTACGSEEPEQPVPVPECEKVERAGAPAPRIEVKKDNIQLAEDRLRVYFDVPEFDEQCRSPFTVRAIAMTWKTPEDVPLGNEPSNEPRSSQTPLRGETVVFNAGAGYFLDAEFPPGADRMSSVVLEITDSAGKKWRTQPFSPLE